MRKRLSFSSGSRSYAAEARPWKVLQKSRVRTYTHTHSGVERAADRPCLALQGPAGPSWCLGSTKTHIAHAQVHVCGHANMHWGGEGGAPSSCSLSHGLAACLPPTPPAGSRTTQLQGPQALVSRARRQLPGPAWQVSFWEKPQRKGAPLGGREELGKVSSLSGLKFPGGGEGHCPPRGL